MQRRNIITNYIKHLILFNLILVSTLVLRVTTYANQILSSTPRQAKAIVTIDGTEVKFNDHMGHPLITDTKRILVPVRIVAENMGYNVDYSKNTWNKGIQKVWIDNGKARVELEIGKSTTLVNNEKKHIDIQDRKQVDTKAISSCK